MYERKSRRLRSQILVLFIQYYFQKNHGYGFVKKSNPSKKKNVIVEEETDCIDIDDIRNLEDSPKLEFIDEECENLIRVDDCGELTGNTSQKKKSDILQQPIDVNSVTNAVDESISSVTILNHLLLIGQVSMIFLVIFLLPKKIRKTGNAFLI